VVVLLVLEEAAADWMNLNPLAPTIFLRYVVVVRWCLGVYKVRFSHKFVYNCCWSVSG
jgi:hypothetical protein